MITYTAADFETLLANVPETIRTLRTQHRIRQEDLAAHAGVSQSMICRIESGRGNPTFSMLIRIVQALNEMASTPEPPLDIDLTPKEKRRLLNVLKNEGVDTSSSTAIKNWLLDQAGIEPEERS